MSVVTISRETCSLGDELAKLLAEQMGFELINRDVVINQWLRPHISDYEVEMLQESPKYSLHQSDEGRSYAQIIEDELRARATQVPVIIEGLGGQLIFRDDPRAVHLRVIASHQSRLHRACQTYGLGTAEGERFLSLSDRKHRRYIWEVFSRDWTDPQLYHLVLNTDGIALEQAAQLLIHFVDLCKQQPRPLGTAAEDRQGSQEPVAFAHPSEAEFAQLLDRYHLRWEYEPTTFPIEWDAGGNVTMAFSPDFYLPEFDTYIELTTMKQQYVSVKNRKIRRLKELYPGINIRMVYGRDFHALVERFGLTRRVEES